MPPLSILALFALLAATPTGPSSRWVVAHEDDLVIAGTIAPDLSVFAVQCQISTHTLWASYAAYGVTPPNQTMEIRFVFGDFIELTDAWQGDRESGLIITVDQKQVLLWIKAAQEAEDFAVWATGLPGQTFTTAGLKPAVDAVLEGCQGAAI